MVITIGKLLHNNLFIRVDLGENKSAREKKTSAYLDMID